MDLVKFTSDLYHTMRGSHNIPINEGKVKESVNDLIRILQEDGYVLKDISVGGSVIDEFTDADIFVVDKNGKEIHGLAIFTIFDSGNIEASYNSDDEVWDITEIMNKIANLTESELKELIEKLS